MTKAIETLAGADAATFRTAVLAAIDAEVDQLADHETRLDSLEHYIWGFSIEGLATAGEVVTRHAVGAGFTIPANFVGALQTLKGVNPTATAAVTIQRSTDGGATWTDVGTISVSTAGAVTATTAAGAAITFNAGDGIRPVAPAVADATFAGWGFTVVGVR